jgi:hypothetical protein
VLLLSTGKHIFSEGTGTREHGMANAVYKVKRMSMESNTYSKQIAKDGRKKR